MNTRYLFQSDRLGFRNWRDEDLQAFAPINEDPEVMAHFPNTLNTRESADFIHRMTAHFEQHGYTYFATELLETKELIGFIGLCNQDYEAPFNPATDIGWRLKKSAWGKGYTTEGSKRCLDYAFQELNIEKVVSVCTKNNIKSENVMRKIGMTKQGTFNHPKLKNHPELEACVWYETVK
ncbi:MAG: GNAT family N-acetyltransferase [Cyclobacteriaceae bacterium]